MKILDKRIAIQCSILGQGQVNFGSASRTGTRFSLKCFNSVKEKLASRLSKMVKEHYERYTRGGLEDEIRSVYIS